MSTLLHSRPWYDPTLWGRRLVRTGVLSRLDRISGGRITVVDGAQTTVCGLADALGLHARIEVLDQRFYSALAWGGSVGAGQAYVDGWWSCDDLPSLVRILARDAHAGAALEHGRARFSAPWRRLRHLLRANTRAGARANIAAHYDLSNAFYAAWLDPTMSYSSCEFSDADDTLEAAALRKLDRIGDRLGLTSAHHVVEIGSGWGGLAVHLAQRHGCRITTTTISHQQAIAARARVAAAGLSERVRVLEHDYRDLPQLLAGDPADRVISVEMIEAIGHRQFATFFATCQRLLKPDGLALIQAISIPQQRYAAARDDVDFIKAHVFPGCCIPSLSALDRARQSASDLELIGYGDLTASYVRTLRAWRLRFLAAWPSLQSLGFDERFRRLWEFYLAYCEGGFAERAIAVGQITLARPQWRTA